MPRRTGSTGVGRGNGAGSRRTQFADGMPSGNPKGRPKKRKVRSATTFIELIQQKLLEQVKVTIGHDADGEPIEKKMRHIDAVAVNMLQKLNKAAFREQVAFFRHLGNGGSLELQKQFQPSETGIAELVAMLAAEAEKDGRFIDEYGRSYRADGSYR